MPVEQFLAGIIGRKVREICRMDRFIMRAD
jgi:hypothetical protein